MSLKIYQLLLVLAVVGINVTTGCRAVSTFRLYPYSLDDNTFKNIIRSENGSLEMHISVQARYNVWFILSPTKGLNMHNLENTDEDYYKISIGTGHNLKTELMTPSMGTVVSVDTPHILSITELRSFYIKISEDGELQVGLEGEAKPIIVYSDPGLLKMKYFFFSTLNLDDIFLYDCSAIGNPKFNLDHEIQPETRANEDKSAENATKPIVDVKDDLEQSENEITVKISRGNAVGAVFAHLDIAVYGGKNDTQVHKHLYGEDGEESVRNQPPYPYSSFRPLTDTEKYVISEFNVTKQRL